MKSTRLFSLAVILLLVFAFTKCTKHKDGSIMTTTDVENIDLDNSAINLKSVSVSSSQAGLMDMKAHRPIKFRPRDGHVCDCKDCFGICDFSKHTLGCPKCILVPDTNNSTGILYICENYTQAESEFGVDFDVDVPDDVLTSYGTITVLSGIYVYISEEDIIRVGDDDYTYYGYVELDLEITDN